MRKFDLNIFSVKPIGRSYTTDTVRNIVNGMIGKLNLRTSVKTKENVEEQEDTKQDDMVKIDKSEDFKETVEEEKNVMWWIDCDCDCDCNCE